MATLYKITLVFAAVCYTYLPVCIAPGGAIEVTLRSADQMFVKFLESFYPAGQSPHPELGEPLVLTTLIKSGRLNVALALASVDPNILIPGMVSYAGYLNVDQEHNSNLWFWYFPMKGEPIGETALIVCLPGMPGVSSLHRVFTEGPYRMSASPYANVLEENTLSWGENYSLLYIDSPVGAGFSFTDHDEGYATSHTMVARHLYTALQQFLQLFPALRATPMVLSGGILASNHVLSLASLIHARKSSRDNLNLAVILIESGFLDPGSMMGYSQYAAELGLVDLDGADAMRASELLIEKAIRDDDNEMAYKLWTNVINLLLDESKIANLFNYVDDKLDTNHLYVDKVEQAKVRIALNVGNKPFTRLGKPYLKLKNDIMSSARKSLEELLECYPVLCYSGQLDVLAAYPLSARLYETLHWSASAVYRRSKRRNWLHNRKFAGFFKTAGNFTEVMVHGAGHSVAADQPERVRAMISTFIQDYRLDIDIGYGPHSEYGK